MLHFRMNMPFILMAFYGSLMIIIVLCSRALLKKRLPKFVFPALWCVVLIRLLVPFSLSSPLSIKFGEDSILSMPMEYIYSFVENISDGFDLATSSEATAYTSQETTADDTLYQGVTVSNIVDDELKIKDTPVSETTAVSGIETIYEGSAAYTGSSDNYYFSSSGFSLIPSRISLPVIYFLGLLITAGILLFQKYRYSGKLKNRLLIEHNETINSILREMSMGHILVFTNDEIASPLVCGLFIPRIYLPTRMDFGNTQLLRHILTHETMHIKRKDNWVKAAMLAALCLNWFNPLVWLMSKCLAQDLETACDEAVLRKYHEDDERKNYAFSLLEMAITGNRATLLYSAFSKTEVERRIQSILSYKKASALLLSVTAIFMLCSTVAFATGVQAPFSSTLTGFCASADSRWGVRIEITRDIALGKNPEKRAADIVFDVLGADTTNDPELMEVQIKNALSEEFNVEKSAFRLDFGLCLSDEEKEKEYAKWELTKDSQGFFIYKGEPVRVYVDETGGYFQSREEGLVDITIKRDRYGDISNIEALHEGDSEFDRRTRENSRTYHFGTTSAIAEDAVINQDGY